MSLRKLMKPLQILPKGVSLCVSLPHLYKRKALQLIEKKGFKIWRTGRDSNPRYAFDVYSLSRGALSTTQPPVRRSVERAGYEHLN